MLNLYRITNLSELDFSYRLIGFELPFIEGKEDLYNKQLLKISQKISSMTGGPAAIVKRRQVFNCYSLRPEFSGDKSGCGRLYNHPESLTRILLRGFK